jgi:hypothetical protein
MRCVPSKLEGTFVQFAVPVGAISTDPCATPDSSSRASTVTAVGSLGLRDLKVMSGGASSMWTATVLVALFGWPSGPTALFQAVHDTVWIPSPSTVTLAAPEVLPTPPVSSVQVVPPTPEGPALALAPTATAWLTQTFGFGSVGVASDTLTGSLSTWSVSEDEVDRPAAFVTLIVSGSVPAPPM